MDLQTPAGMSFSATRTEALKSFVAEIFAKLGVPPEAARLAAAALVAADVEGMSSHGVRLVPLYVERMLAGAVSKATEPVIVHDGGTAIVLDARNALGPVSADWAIPIVSERAREHGLACITVRNGAHFGTAAYWARPIAESGLVGIVMSNGAPLKRPPGGTERLTGKNSLAIALPSSDPRPFVMDLDAESLPFDPASAIAALLVPNAAGRAFGLAAAIDLFCGALSGGTVGPDADTFACSHLFMAIDPARFGMKDVPARVAEFANRVRNSKPAPGVERVYAPGDRAHARRAEKGDECLLAPEVVTTLKECAAKVGVQASLE